MWATPPSDDGESFGEAILVGSADVALPFTRGYVHFTTHNHATLKYSNDAIDAWVARWDNLGFDGPRDHRRVPRIRGARRAHHRRRPARRTSPIAWPTFRRARRRRSRFTTVDIQGATRAYLALQNWSLHAAGSEPQADYALNYRVNDGPWKARALTASELRMMTELPNAGTRSFLLDVDVADLVAGTNRLQFTTANANMGYPPVVLNIDLILETP